LRLNSKIKPHFSNTRKNIRYTYTQSKYPSIFADTNILVYYSNKNQIELCKFLESKNVYFTETVSNELYKKSSIQFPDNFRLINSGLKDWMKESAYNDLCNKWKIINTMTDKQKEKFRNDIYIIFEASYGIFAEGIKWEAGKDAMPYLLTNNLLLYKKFLDTEKEKGHFRRYYKFIRYGTYDYNKNFR